MKGKVSIVGILLLIIAIVFGLFAFAAGRGMRSAVDSVIEEVVTQNKEDAEAEKSE